MLLSYYGISRAVKMTLHTYYGRSRKRSRVLSVPQTTTALDSWFSATRYRSETVCRVLRDFPPGEGDQCIYETCANNEALHHWQWEGNSGIGCLATVNGKCDGWPKWAVVGCGWEVISRYRPPRISVSPTHYKTSLLYSPRCF
ncbi:hypothetical protein J6590_087079 [Homalodisca vitripennis]|nr:hypothetical protein J6590_087079 [Homalodisca vitripennis]